MSRISREQMLMEMAHIASKRGTCGRLAVGAVIAIESRPISIGYVGALPGAPHCGEPKSNCNVTRPCHRTVHAELNAINFAIRHGIDIDGADMYITDSPCPLCAEEISDHHIRRVFFDRLYRDPAGIDLLRAGDIEVTQILPNGMIRKF